MRFGWNQYGASCHSGFGGFSMMIGGLLLTALLIYGLVVLIRREQTRSYQGAAGDGQYPVSRESAIAILDERYARGELGDEDYARRKSELRKR